MTEDQIKAIAEEYVESQKPKTNTEFDEFFLNLPILKEALQNQKEDVATFLTWLSARYCIVEREKVMEACKFADVSYSIRNHITPLYREAMKNALEYLFGTSMFNQDEE